MPGHINIEMKARCADRARIRRILQERAARFVGEDHQVDTYFRVTEGRLKLREGEIERNLIYYRRPDATGPRQSDVILHPVGDAATLKACLAAAMGVLTVVDKRREIWFIDNVKFHLDVVEGLGEFVEIEAIGETADADPAPLHRQCVQYMDLFGISAEATETASYSDLLMRKVSDVMLPGAGGHGR